MPRSRPDPLLATLAAGPVPVDQALARLIDWVRPGRGGAATQAVVRLEEIAQTLAERIDLREAVRGRLHDWLANARQLELYTDTDILPARGFAAELTARLYERVLPAPPRAAELRDALGVVFGRRDDARWIAEVPPETWMQALEAIDFFSGHPALAATRTAAATALEVLAVRLAAAGLDRELLRVEPALVGAGNPFLVAQRALAAVADAARRGMAGDEPATRAMLYAASTEVERVRTGAMRRGTSVHLSYLLLRMEQTLARLGRLLGTLAAHDRYARRREAMVLLADLVRGDAERHGLRRLWRDGTRLLARRVTENASRAGEHYITATRAEWGGMLRSAALGGAVIAFMALAKLGIKAAHLPPLVEALAVSLNYGLGFVLIHVLHGTVATKQPAMTAATLVRGLEEGERRGRPVEAMAGVVAQVTRTQWIAVAGNVLVALPVALAVWAVFAAAGSPPLDVAKAAALQRELWPFAGLALLHAVIAGVWLFAAGLVAGWYDNRCAWLDVPGRLRAHPLLVRWLPARARERLAAYVDGNLGALAGNLAFGFMLGMTGFAGFLVGLPLDIRHVAFAAANLGYSAAPAWPGAVAFGLLAGCVLLVGLANLAVSFALAFWVALRARGVSAGRTLPALGVALIAEAARRPLSFVLPPRSP